MSQNETGSVLTPDYQHTTGSDVMVQVNNNESKLVTDAKNRLVESRASQLFKGAVTGKHYLVYIDEQPGQPISVGMIEQEFGENKKYNPRPPYQRPTGQHPVKIQKGILLDFLCGERVGTLVLYSRVNHHQIELVDGGQRTDIVRRFLKGKLELKGQQAAKFWAYYLPDIIRGHSQREDNVLQIESNKILKSIASNKTVPTVKFESLPYNLRNSIRNLTFDVKMISKILFQCIEDGKLLSFESADYDEHKVIEMVRSKFNKLNLQQKPVQPIHQIWGARDQYNITARSYVERIPGLMSAFGYTLENDGSSKDEEIVRTFNDLLVRSMLGYDGKIKWGLGIQKVAENLLEATYDDEIPTEPNSFGFIEFMNKRLGKVFEIPFSDNNNVTRKIELAREIVGVGQKAVMQRLFILSLMEFWAFIQENKLASKYISGEIPNPRLYNFVELLSKIISCVSMRTLEESEYKNDSRPLMKYGLFNMYKSNQKLFDNLIRLGGHSQKDDYLVKDTLNGIVKLIDEYTL
jgi:hypothetical protein